MPVFKKHLGTLRIGKRSYDVLVSNAVAAGAFFIAGSLMLALTYSGGLSPSMDGGGTAKIINNVAGEVTVFINRLPGADLATVALIGLVAYLIIKRRQAKKAAPKNHTHCEHDGHE